MKYACDIFFLYYDEKPKDRVVWLSFFFSFVHFI